MLALTLAVARAAAALDSAGLHVASRILSGIHLSTRLNRSDLADVVTYNAHLLSACSRYATATGGDAGPAERARAELETVFQLLKGEINALESHDGS